MKRALALREMLQEANPLALVRAVELAERVLDARTSNTGGPLASRWGS